MYVKRKEPKKILVITVLLLAAFWGNAQQIKFDEWKNLTTSGKLPAECEIQHSQQKL
jgi:hypothetical protein